MVCTFRTVRIVDHRISRWHSESTKRDSGSKDKGRNCWIQWIIRDKTIRSQAPLSEVAASCAIPWYAWISIAICLMNPRRGSILNAHEVWTCGGTCERRHDVMVVTRTGLRTQVHRVMFWMKVDCGRRTRRLFTNRNRIVTVRLGEIMHDKRSLTLPPAVSVGRQFAA